MPAEHLAVEQSDDRLRVPHIYGQDHVRTSCRAASAARHRSVA
jgi:hypothetical protein